jgi:hypothetical protein
VLEEPYYFDRDYLASFRAFYGDSPRGYENACVRLTFFSPLEGERELRSDLEAACGNDAAAQQRLQDAFLGFCVVRPIPAKLGRTVVAWYPDDKEDDPKRVIAPCRSYAVNIAGVRLCVSGLAWQQQDTNVAACATIGIWTMMQSSGFQDRLALPTTASITEAAHRTASLGERIFPTAGLLNHHMLEAIKEHALAPLLIDGDLDDGHGPIFSVDRFSATCASLLRSGFPVLVIGRRGDEGHVMCAVGFRPSAPGPLESGETREEDRELISLYVHDDALGPNVRFRVEVENEPPHSAILVAHAPEPRNGQRPVADPTAEVAPFLPRHVVVAVVPEVRVSPDILHRRGYAIAAELSTQIEGIETSQRPKNAGVRFGVTTILLSSYFRDVLGSTVKDGKPLERARLDLVECVPPMSLYVAVVRVSIAGVPMLDVLFDTTDPTDNLDPFAHVVLDAEVAWLLESAQLALGARVQAFVGQADSVE